MSTKHQSSRPRMFRYCSSSGSLYSISSGSLSAIEISLSRFCCPAFYLGTCAATIQKCVAILLVASTHILRIFFVSYAAAAETSTDGESPSGRTYLYSAPVHMCRWPASTCGISQHSLRKAKSCKRCCRWRRSTSARQT
jgi:hypothetical protein